MTIHAPDVSLTDFAIALLCIYFAIRLGAMQAMHHDLRKLFVGMFLSTAVAAAAGGVHHGFFEVEKTVWTRVSWLTSLIAIGCTAFYLWHIAIYFGLPQRWRRWTGFILQSALLIYGLYVVRVSDEFIVAIAAYLPAVLFFLGVLTIRFFKSRDSRFMLALFGLLITIAAAGIQVMKIGVHPQYFNHNALYHLVQAVGLYFLYRFAARVIVWS